MKTYQIILIIIGSILLYFIIGYLFYRFRIWKLRKKRKLVSEKIRREVFFYYLCCYTPRFLLACAAGECNTCDRYDFDDSIPTIPKAKTTGKQSTRWQRNRSGSEEGASLEKEEIINTEEARKRISELITDKNYVSINWINSVTLVPIETIYELISQDESFRLVDDKVIRKKLLEGICPGCDVLYSTYSNYCPNCGEKLERRQG